MAGNRLQHITDRQFGHTRDKSGQPKVSRSVLEKVRAYKTPKPKKKKVLSVSWNL